MNYTTDTTLLYAIINLKTNMSAIATAATVAAFKQSILLGQQHSSLPAVTPNPSDPNIPTKPVANQKRKSPEKITPNNNNPNTPKPPKPKKPRKKVEPPRLIESKFPKIWNFVKFEGGEIVIGYDRRARAFLQAHNCGGTVWRGKTSYKSLDLTLEALEQGIKGATRELYGAESTEDSASDHSFDEISFS